MLLIETVERHLRERFSKPFRNLKSEKNIKTIENANSPIEGWGAIPYKTERHESALFSNDFFLTIKEWKSWINWKFFNRTDSLVAVSPDGKHLLYGTDVQEGINSCFDKVSDAEINQIVKNINNTYDYYKKAGFTEVYLTICPNKTSILATELGEYNHLIERIQQHKDLKIPFVDVYTQFKSSKKILYDIGDTHWNCEGKILWLNDINERMKLLL